MLHRIMIGVATLLLSLPAGQVSADKVGNLSSKLERSDSTKVRIAAALSLAKLDDKRAVAALTQALRDDDSADIRRISAASLGQRMSSLSGSTRKQALSALGDAAAKDKDKNVRASAEVALSKSALKSEATDSSAKGILVDVATPAIRNKHLSAATGTLLASTVKQSIRESAPKNVQTAPGTGMPSSKQLKKKGLAGYSIIPELSELKMTRKGGKVHVTCEVRMRLEPWVAEGGKLAVDRTATVTGAGAVTSANSNKALAASSTECLTAVVAKVTSSQVVPFLAAKTR